MAVGRLFFTHATDIPVKLGTDMKQFVENDTDHLRWLHVEETGHVEVNEIEKFPVFNSDAGHLVVASTITNNTASSLEAEGDQLTEGSAPGA
jgi:hypothetical protein